MVEFIARRPKADEAILRDCFASLAMTVLKLKEGKMTKIKVELSIPTELKDEPLIYTMGREFEIIPNIIEASFSTSTGWAILTFEGEKEELERLLGYLKDKNISVNIL